MQKLLKYFLAINIFVIFTAANLYSSSFFFNTNIKNYNIQIDSIYSAFKEKLNVYNFAISEKLPLVTFPDFDSTFTTNDEKINIVVNLPSKIRYANIYIFINQKKVDLFYKVNGGEYTFKNVRLFAGNNNVEVFYVIGDTRSQSTSILINKQ